MASTEESRMKLNFLSGGTGTPKLLQGFREILDDSQLSIICNGGDDILWHDLRVCPDLDTVLYLFSNRLDTDKFWGVKDDKFTTVEELKELGSDEWFSIGGKDLGLHLFRTQMLKDYSLTAVTREISQKWGIKANVYPMSDDLIQSQIHSGSASYSFQEFFVKHRTEPHVDRVEFSGNKSTTPEVLDVLDPKTPLIIGPSNPVTSIGPILSIDAIMEKLVENRKNNLAVSPIISDAAFSGPTVKLMKVMGIETSPLGIAHHYRSIISKLILDPNDRIFADRITDLGVEPIFLPIFLKTREQKISLAREILNIL